MKVHSNGRATWLGRNLHDRPRFTADDSAVIVTSATGRLIRVDLATGARRHIGSTTGFFDVG